jgi:fucose 4-O-acetylase-like acetyltransferase
MKTCEKEQDSIKGHRIHFLDNLRTFMIFLVVVCHAGGVYESSGAWASFWIVDDPSTNNQSGLVFLILDIFIMPTLFFISGFFAPLSMERRNKWTFLESKFKRLIVPWMIAVLTLIPLYKIIFLFSRNLPQESWTTYFHWSNRVWSQNWLWFLPVLFLFDVLYLLISRVKFRIPNLSLKGAVLIAFFIGYIYSVGMDVLGLRGWTHTVVLDFQNERLLIYFIAFLLGAYCFRRKVFDPKPKSMVLYIIVNSTAWIPVMVYIIFLLYPWFKPGHYIVAKIPHQLILWFSFQLSLFCLMYVVIETFRRYFDKPGKIRNELKRNSYGVYVIHVIVIGGVALLMLNAAIPSVLKYLILTVATYVVCNGIIYFYRRAILMPFNSTSMLITT